MLHVLLHNHTHAGKEYKAGETVDLPEDAVEWLLAFEGKDRAERVKNEDKAQTLIEEYASRSSE